MSDLKQATADRCLVEGGALAAATGRLLASTGEIVVAAPTLVGAIPVALGFIGSAVTTAAAAALYLNCRDEAAATSKAK